MQEIRALCSECKEDARLPPEAVTVVENQIDPNGSSYSFTCPECGRAVTKPAGDAVLKILRVAQGIRWSVVRIPDELLEPKVGPPIDLDDLIDFMREMEKL